MHKDPNHFLVRRGGVVYRSRTALTNYVDVQSCFQKSSGHLGIIHLCSGDMEGSITGTVRGLEINAPIEKSDTKGEFWLTLGSKIASPENNLLSKPAGSEVIVKSCSSAFCAVSSPSSDILL